MFGLLILAAAVQNRAAPDVPGLSGTLWDASEAHYLTREINSAILYMLVAYISRFSN